MSVPAVYVQQYRVLSHDCDLKNRMRPAALLRYTQQIATDHAALAGFTPEYYQENHLAFLLAKQSLEFTRLPGAGELLTLTTHPEGSKRASWKRVTIVTDEQGREVACVDSRWILVDTQTRRILRRPLDTMVRFWSEDVERELIQRIPKAETVQAVCTRRADYSLCDTNGHLNNTCYVDLACDILPAEQLLQQGVRRVIVSYHREIPFGQFVELLRGEADGGWYVCGRREEQPAFEVWCGF